MLDIRELCKTSHEIAKTAGWLDHPRSNADIINLFVSEISEALEDYRAHRGVNEVYYEYKGQKFTKEERDRSVEPPAKDFKPCGIPIELADLIIRICEFMGTNGKTPDFAAVYRSLGFQPKDLYEPSVAGVDRFLFTLTNACVSAWHEKELYLTPLAGAIRWIEIFSRKHDIDIVAAVKEKEAYNRTRSYRHGGKKI